MGSENINLGTCNVTFNSVDLGLTIGGVEVEVVTETYQTTVDQFGNTVVAERIIGRNIRVSVPMAETTLEKLAEVMPGATLVTDSVDSNIKKVEVATGIGTNLRASAQKLELHPVELPVSDKSQDLVIPLANTPGGVNFAYKIDQERVFNADFVGYPDANGLLWIYGDEAATA